MIEFRYTPTLTAEDRAMCVLEALNAPGTKVYFEESMPGPVLCVAGEMRALDDWAEWDYLESRGYMAVSEADRTAGPTWAGIKALRKWQRKNGR